MPLFVCTACGTQFPESATPPANCRICDEERQFVPTGGQGWTTLAQSAAGHSNGFRQLEPGILSIETRPHFAIGQRALLVETPGGNVLWDCIALLDAATIKLIKGLGGLKAVAISHPHYYTTMVEWARAFDCPVYLHAADREWVSRPDKTIQHWDGETRTLWDGVTLIRCGGHYPGGTVLHWAGGAAGRGVVCAGDILFITQDRQWVSFMRSYPNYIPLSKREVEGIGAALAPFAFETIYGHFGDRVVEKNGKQVVEKSVMRYVAAIEGKRGY